jgi:nicotinamidase-related amidase
MKRALLVIDAQRIYTDPSSALFCKDSAATISNINKLIDSFELSKEPIVFVLHVYKSDGSDLGRMRDFAGKPRGDFRFKENSREVELDDRIKFNEVHKTITKNRYSAFVNTDMDEYLHAEGVDRVVICGFMTNFCCESAARHAHDLDYFVDFIADATGTPGTESLDQEGVRRIVSEFLKYGFAVIRNTDEYLSS